MGEDRRSVVNEGCCGQAVVEYGDGGNDEKLAESTKNTGHILVREQ